MNLQHLKERLQDQGYGPLIAENGPGLISISDCRIERVADQWRVCATERGEVLETYLTTRDESEACHYWYDSIAGRMLHLATFTAAGDARSLQRALEMAGVKVWRNDIPSFNGPNDARYRIFTEGRDLKRARLILEQRTSR
jgi:hypothetical protein